MRGHALPGKGHQRGVRRHDQLAGQLGDPVGGRRLDSGGLEGICAGLQRHDKGVARKLGMALPDQAEVFQVHAVMLDAWPRRRCAIAPGEFSHNLAVGVRIRPVRGQREAGEFHCAVQRLRRARVHLVAEAVALVMVTRQCQHACLSPERIRREMERTAAKSRAVMCRSGAPGRWRRPAFRRSRRRRARHLPHGRGGRGRASGSWSPSGSAAPVRPRAVTARRGRMHR